MTSVSTDDSSVASVPSRLVDLSEVVAISSLASVEDFFEVSSLTAEASVAPSAVPWSSDASVPPSSWPGKKSLVI